MERLFDGLRAEEIRPTVLFRSRATTEVKVVRVVSGMDEKKVYELLCAGRFASGRIAIGRVRRTKSTPWTLRTDLAPIGYKKEPGLQRTLSKGQRYRKHVTMKQDNQLYRLVRLVKVSVS